jgi:sortase A
LRISVAILIIALSVQPVYADGPILLPPNEPTTPATYVYIPAIKLFRQVSVVNFRNGNWETAYVIHNVMHLQGTTSPGKVGNIVLAGHREWAGKRGPFYHLDLLAIGDPIYVYDSTRWYKYIMEFSIIVDVDAAHVVAPTSSPILTLLTCYNISDKRLVVVARLGD